jgi:hypothetical protein
MLSFSNCKIDGRIPLDHKILPSEPGTRVPQCILDTHRTEELYSRLCAKSCHESYGGVPKGLFKQCNIGLAFLGFHSPGFWVLVCFLGLQGLRTEIHDASDLGAG